MGGVEEKRQVQGIIVVCVETGITVREKRDRNRENK